MKKKGNYKISEIFWNKKIYYDTQASQGFQWNKKIPCHIIKQLTINTDSLQFCLQEPQ